MSAVLLLVLACLPPLNCPPCFVRGDASGNGVVTPVDALGVLEYLFVGGSLGCLDAADANDDGRVDVSDAVRILSWFYGGGHGPGWMIVSDFTPDTLDCAVGLPCE